MYKVVIVEDEELARRGIALTVGWAAMGCVVVGDAADGASGADMILKLEPDIVITDVEMPGMDGVQMVHALRKQNCTAEIIILTAHSDFSYAHSALKAGVADYLLKPFADGELEEAVKKVTARLEEKYSVPQTTGPLVRFNIPKGGKSKYVELAIQYIRENYGNSELTVATVADSLGISVGYVSRMFKKETEYTFVGYLTQYRIHTAMNLLKDITVKVYEVAEQVGYQDTTYFSSLFKRLCGISPSEYQDRCN